MFEFIKEYLRHPFKIGAIVPSSKYLAACITKPINFQECDCIVEYGPGTGVFTKEIINKKRESTLFLMIEQNRTFYNKLARQYGKIPGVKVIHGKAENIEDYMKRFHIDSVDYIISGLPFASLPKEVSNSILTKTKQVINRNGKFITFQYSMVKRNLFEQYFSIKNRIQEYRNLPPAYVLVMQNNKRQTL